MLLIPYCNSLATQTVEQSRDGVATDSEVEAVGAKPLRDVGIECAFPCFTHPTFPRHLLNEAGAFTAGIGVSHRGCGPHGKPKRRHTEEDENGQLSPIATPE